MCYYIIVQFFKIKLLILNFKIMLKKYILTIGVGFMALGLGLTQAQPAQAFQLSLPNYLKAIWPAKMTVEAQQGGTFGPPPGGRGGGGGNTFGPPPGGGVVTRVQEI